MRIVVIGDGKVGYILTKLLAQEGHDVVVIDRNPMVLRDAQEKLDVAVLTGNGACAEVQREAGVPDSDLLIAATSSDEVNLLCSLIAHKLGCRHIVARVRNPEYDQQMSLLKADLGLSFTINPEKSAASEIFRLLQFPQFLKRDSFAGGRAEMVEIKLPKDSRFIGRRIDQISDMLKRRALICVVDRGGKIFIPSGQFTIFSEDKLTIMAATAELPDLIRRFGVPTKTVEKVMIIGGSRTAAYLTKQLLAARVEVTILERSYERCEELFELLPEATIINGDGTMQSLLLDEGVEEMDAVISLTGMDEENLLVSMFANYIGVPKTITKINRLEYTDVLSTIGVDTLVSPKLLTANEIVRYVRAVGESGQDSVETLYRIGEGKAEGLGFTVPQTGAFLGIPLERLPIRKGILLASIVRNQQVIIPRGSDCMMPSDAVIVVAGPEQTIARLTDIFTDNEGRAL